MTGTSVQELHLWGAMSGSRKNGNGHTATIAIAARDASAAFMAAADYVCRGFDDDLMVQAAANLLPAGGGTIILSDGNYYASGGVIIDSESGERSVKIEGQGRYATSWHFPYGVKAFKLGTHATTGHATIGSTVSKLKLKATGATGDGTTIGIDTDGVELCRFEDVLIEDADWGFVLRNLDRCTLMETRVGNPKLGGYKLVQAGPSVGGHNNWGTLVAINAEYALSENNSKGVYATKEGDGSNPLARIAWIGTMLFSSTTPTGTIGVHFDDIGCVATAFYSCIFENNLKQLKTDSECHIGFHSCEFLRSGSNSTYTLQAGAFGTFSFYDCAFQRATTAFQADSGFPRIAFYGGNKNDGNIGSLFGGSWGGKLGTDMAFAGTDTLALGTSATDRMDYVFSTHVVAADMRLTDGISAPDAESGKAILYVDGADGDLKVRYGDGTIKTIVVDT